MIEYQNIQIFFLKDKLQIGLKKFMWLKKLKILFHVINDLNGEDIIETIYEKELQRANQQGFKIRKKSLKEKETYYMLNREDMITYLIAGLIKKDLIE